MRRALSVALVVALFVIGAAVSLAGVGVHEMWWGDLLVIVATVALQLAVRPGWQRITLTLGWLVPLGLVIAERPEGDFAITSDLGGYVLVGLALLSVLLTTATLPFRPRRSDSDTRDG